MRHLNKGRKLNRTSSHRKAMFSNLAVSLFKHGQIETTTAKAKDLRCIAENLIQLGKRGDLHARRQAYRIIRERDVLSKLFNEIAPNYLSRNGGYTRIFKNGYRKGDAAPLSIIELVA